MRPGRVPEEVDARPFENSSIPLRDTPVVQGAPQPNVGAAPGRHKDVLGRKLFSLYFSWGSRLT